MFDLSLAWDRPNRIPSVESSHTLRLRLQPQRGSQNRTLPLQLAIALDTSGSMEGQKLEQAKVACRTVLEQLRDQDTVSLASFSSQIQTHLDACRGRERSTSMGAIDRLQSGGTTRVDLALQWLQQRLRLSNIQGNGAQPARVAILITDGHPTNNQGRILENTAPLVEQARALAESGIILCAVGLGNAANFNTEFLVSLSDTGSGEFIYADTPDRLTPQLSDRLAACQSFVVDALALKLEPAAGVQVRGVCQYRPQFLPLEETKPLEFSLRGIQGDRPTDILIDVQVNALAIGQQPDQQPILSLRLDGEGLGSGLQTQATLHCTSSYSEAQEQNNEVNSDRLGWLMNRYTADMARTQDPNRTGELLLDYQVAAMKSGQVGLANQAAQQLADLQARGQLNPHGTTGLLSQTRKLGDTPSGNHNGGQA
ncbi:MAG: vWA domain-containing protein [Prochlorotrichaceae cyanobacterium]